MKRFCCSLIFVFFLGGQLSFSQRKADVLSPDGKLKFSFSLGRESLLYSVSFRNQVIVSESPLSFDFDNGYFGKGLKMGKPVYSKIDDHYELIVGKAKNIRNHCNEMRIPLEEVQEPFRKMNLIVRVFDDGLAFRYEFPEQANWKSYVMYGENTTFNLVGNPRALALFIPSYTTSHEGLYTDVMYNRMEENKLMDMPVSFSFGDQIFLSITEAALVDYAGMYLTKRDGILESKLSPWIGQDKILVKAELPHKTPWRVMLIGNKIGTLIESNILTSLNEPCKFPDTSWIKPGKTTFTWWNGNVVPDTTFSPGNNFETNRYYIDFASRNGLDFHSIYGYAEQPWYVDDGFDFSKPGKNVDVTKSIAPLDMKRICDYAADKGVRIHVWVNWKALYAKIDEAFAQFEKWGIAGMMVDFMDRDDQEMIRIQEEILAKAAKHKLFIQFHGSSKPSGLHRTYPNEFTREGTLNYECYKWSTNMNADHDIAMPFTRGLAGPADYHLGGFRSVPPSEFKIRYTNPLVTSTRCHMLGMYLALDSYLAMICDTPPSYEGQPGFDFLKRLPTVWDETKVLDAQFKEYLVIARKHQDEWYVGSINNSKQRNVSVSFDFLQDEEYDAEIYSDAPDVNFNPNHLKKQTLTVTPKDKVDLTLASDGGFVMRLKKK